MPVKPRPRPNNARLENRSPFGSSRSTRADQNGVVAISTAVNPLATCCWAYTTKPLPTTFIRNPRSSSGPHIAGRGKPRPVASITADNTTPAAIHRSPATSNTGTVSSATLIAR